MTVPNEPQPAGASMTPDRNQENHCLLAQSPTTHPHTAATIVPMLAARSGLRVIPPLLEQLAVQGHRLLCPDTMSRISLGMATCGQAAGAGKRSALLAARPDFINKVIVRNVGCLGACFGEPLADVRTPDGLHYIFGRIGSHVHWPIINTAQMRTFQRGTWLVLREREPGILTGYEDLAVERIVDRRFAAFFEHQARRISGNCGIIDPHSLPEYVAAGGYFAFTKALLELSPAQVVAEITDSGLRGRGVGAASEPAISGRPPPPAVTGTGLSSPMRMKAIPAPTWTGPFWKAIPTGSWRGSCWPLMPSAPDRAHIFVRHEYPLSVETLRHAIDDAHAAGLLGENILGTDFSLQVGITQSGGRFRVRRRDLHASGHAGASRRTVAAPALSGANRV